MEVEGRLPSDRRQWDRARICSMFRVDISMLLQGSVLAIVVFPIGLAYSMRSMVRGIISQNGTALEQVSWLHASLITARILLFLLDHSSMSVSRLPIALSIVRYSSLLAEFSSRGSRPERS